MALRNATAQTSVPAFEDMPVADAAAPVTPAPNTKPVNTPPAVVQGGAIAKASSKFSPALSDFENVIAPEDVAALGPGTFPKVTVDLGGFVLDKTTVLGPEIEIEMISWNKRWVISPGVNDAEANDHVRFSTDGETISDGRTIKEYIEHLRNVEGYEKADVKEYFSLWANLTKTKDGDVSPEKQQMVEVQLSPQSAAQFKRYQLEQGMKISRGISTESPMIRLTSERRNLKGNNFGIAIFHAA